MTKKYSNTPKGRAKIPKSPGAYNLKSRNDKTVYTGETKNLQRRVKEHNRDPNKHFSTVTVSPTKTKGQANKIENRRLAQSKPKYNKTKK